MKIKLLLVLVALTGVAFAPLARAQKDDKPWTDWSKKDAESVLTNSPWCHTQVETNTDEMFFSPTGTGTATAAQSPGTRNPSAQQSVNDARMDRGSTNQSVDVKYRIRFFSARPVRQALARLMALQQQMAPAALERLRAFAEVESTNSIIVTVTFESKDGRFTGQALQAFASAVTATLKNNTYLERSSDGKRLFLEEYVPPGKDGFGARFIFLRTMDGQTFITPTAGNVRFFSEFGEKSVKLDKQFKVAEMIYKGQLEY
jgi:hypothetical protein